MRFRLFTLLLLSSSLISLSQNRDRIWVFGDSTGINFNDLSNPIPIATNSSYIDENNASISDEAGNLQFYIGGVADSTGYVFYPRMRIFNKNGEIMDNGDSISSDYSETNGLVIIPFPYNPDKYYLFHLLHVTYQSKLYYSIIDMSYNGGLGKVIDKNIEIQITINDSLCEKLAAVKHSNGIDWWLLFHAYGSSRFYKFIINGDGISSPAVQDIGSCHCAGLQGYGESCFSNNGDKYMCVTYGLADVFSFDRCTGVLTLLAQMGDSINPDHPFYYGCSFSPSGRFIYISSVLDAYSSNKLWQFDLNASDILESKVEVYDGPQGNYQTTPGQHQIGPDGKIYITFSLGVPFLSVNIDSTNTSLSVINSPDSLGLGCNFYPFSFYLDGRRTALGLPNMPNYNLGEMEGIDCDTTLNAIVSLSSDFYFDLFPNPSSSQFIIQSNIPHSRTFSIQNLFGQIIFSEKFPATEEVIDVSELPGGVYFVTLHSEAGVFSRKMVKQ